MVSAVLAALVATELLRIGLLLPPLIGMGSVEAKTGGTANLLQSAMAPRRPDIRKIVEAHLFGVVASNEPSADSASPSTAANLLLTGTIATRNPKSGSAIVSDNGKSALYRVGGQVGGASVYLVYNDRVILNRSGKLEVLSLPRSLPAAGTGSAEHMAGVEAPSTRVGDPGGLANVMRVGAAVNNESGQVRGFRIYPGKDRSAFTSAGLRMGDLVVAVNGTSVLEQNRQDSQDAFKSIGNSPRATMTIERFGRTTDVTIDVDQAGTSATTDPPAVMRDATSVQ
jgi:general secretion pathway protein C